MRPVLIIMVWKPCRSIAQSLMSVRATEIQGKTVEKWRKAAKSAIMDALNMFILYVLYVANFLMFQICSSYIVRML